MKMALFGSGMIGQRVAQEALSRGWEVYRKNSDLDWTYFSPPVFIEPGERTGTYRLGIDQLVMNEQGECRISAEDYAVALLDELEQRRFVRQRFSVAY